MSTPILATKLYISPPRPNTVRRRRLIEAIDEGIRLQRKLTLISAPAGFGKTTLVSNWIDHLQSEESKESGGKIAWLSLGEDDNDLIRFITYVVAALQTINSNIGAGILSLLQSPQSLPANLILTTLINELAETTQKFTLVLDDYHLIESRSIHESVAFFIDHLPPQLHLVIASRSDPPLSLARLRGRGELTELRAIDLRFTLDEAVEFLNQMMGLTLSVEEVAALEKRTEGWITGLQMVALALQGSHARQSHPDTTDFIQDFTGSHRFILDYLVEEVLQQQSEQVRTFLLQTAILDRLSDSLCQAVQFGLDSTSEGSAEENASQHENNKGLLETLERHNLFVIPLDNQRQWYRYHHLFADVLQARLLAEQPDQLPVLHQNASEWYDANNLPSEAIRHAFAAEDLARAATLIEVAWPAFRRDGQEGPMLAWMKKLPDELVRTRPVLNVAYALILLNHNLLDAAEARLQEAEQWLTSSRQRETLSSQMVVIDNKQFRFLPASIANARAYRAQALGDISGTVMYAQQALTLLEEDDYYERGTTAALLGLAYWASGDLEAAHSSFAEGLATFQKTDGFAITIGGALILGNIRLAQGYLHEAVIDYEQALQLAAEQTMYQGTAGLYLGLGEIQLERGDLEGAKQQLLKGKALGKHAASPNTKYLWRIIEAKIAEGQGNLDEALAFLNEAEQLYYPSPIPDVRPIMAMKVSVWLKQNRLTEALSWARERNLSVDNEINYVQEFEHLTLVRILIAQYKQTQTDEIIHQAITFLDRLLQAAESEKRIGSQIEILILQAVAYEAREKIPAALASLTRALTLAEPEGHIHIFVNEGEVIAQLLREATHRHILPTYIDKLLAAFDNRDPHPPVDKSENLAPSTFPLTETLSQRELEVLRLFKTELSGPEIARELTIALSTVRTHTKNIYSKLNVNNRRAAVKRASELGLI
ncbi:MAG: LuxR C-terminal-related transcriptional regulator [Chloroflexota bacterium]